MLQFEHRKERLAESHYRAVTHAQTKTGNREKESSRVVWGGVQWNWLVREIPVYHKIASEFPVLVVYEFLIARSIL